jgi:hypothetical protein
MYMSLSLFLSHWRRTSGRMLAGFPRRSGWLSYRRDQAFSALDGNLQALYRMPGTGFEPC